METDTNLIMNQLKLITQALGNIQERMVEKDEIMVLEEFEAYKKSLDKKNLISFEKAKEQLNL